MYHSMASILSCCVVDRTCHNACPPSCFVIDRTCHNACPPSCFVIDRTCHNACPPSCFVVDRTCHNACPSSCLVVDRHVAPDGAKTPWCMAPTAAWVWAHKALRTMTSWQRALVTGSSSLGRALPASFLPPCTEPLLPASERYV